MDWAAPQLRRFDFSFPDALPAIPAPDPPPVKPHAESRRSLDVVCYGVPSAALLSLTRSSHPLFLSHCYTGLQTYSGAELMARIILARPQILRSSRAVLEM